ncbi:unnamed protein product [Caenorhabditis angaria]|uniref:Uncharacterized protein n=1 Tax=Caenorhabditis angaria TaxID=860376 RepID=A0A9P1I5C7_9PELO|nr:unnamed protein product [Caenorhabditis angaria]
MSEDSSISTSFFDDASYCSGELTTSSYTVTQIYKGWDPSSKYYIADSRSFAGSDIINNNRSPIERTSENEDEQKTESTFCGTMDSTQVSACEKTDCPALSSNRLRISYEKPKIFYLDYRKCSNILGCFLFLTIISEIAFILWATDIEFINFVQFSGDSDSKLLVFLTFSEYCLVTSLFFIIPHFVLLFIRCSISTSMASTFFSVLSSISLCLAEKFLWNGYNDISDDLEMSRKVRVSLLIHSINLLYSITVVLTSSFSIFIEYKASTFAIAY